MHTFFKHGVSCGRYKFVATLGEGSTAICFTVKKFETSELCVLKVRFPTEPPRACTLDDVRCAMADGQWTATGSQDKRHIVHNS